MEAYYQFFDRDAVDPLLSMRWPEYMDRSFTDEEDAREFVEFAFDGGEGITDVLSRRTLRWTMQRSSPQYHFLAVIIDAAGGGPYVACNPFETAILLAVAVEAVLTGLSDRATLHAVLKINAASRPSDWLEISERDEKPLLRGWRPELMARPIYAWQGDDAHLCCGDTALGVADTRRLIRFLMRAWQENWPAPRLTRDTLRFRIKRKQSAPHFRDFQLARDVHTGLVDWEARRPSVFRRCE
jgi:hypothetical protein